MDMTDRYKVMVWPPAGLLGPGQTQTYHVWDRHTGGWILGRWDTQEAAQEYADRCNQDQT